VRGAVLVAMRLAPTVRPEPVLAVSAPFVMFFHKLTIVLTGLVCTDAGITSGVLLSEYGFGDFGSFGGLRTAWDLSRVDGIVNLPTRLQSSDGQSVTCTPQFCPREQAYEKFDDFVADRNSAVGQTFTHTFCP
jgi:hypothetical protein